MTSARLGKLSPKVLICHLQQQCHIAPSVSGEGDWRGALECALLGAQGSGHALYAPCPPPSPVITVRFWTAEAGQADTCGAEK